MSFYNIFNNLLSTTNTGTGGAVSSVAGKTGTVILDSNDVTNFQLSVSTNSDVVENKTKTTNIDKVLTVPNRTKLHGDLIASKFRSSDYFDESGTSGIKIIQNTGQITLNSNSYISNIGKFLKIHTNGLITADLPTGSGIQTIVRYAKTSNQIFSGNADIYVHSFSTNTTGNITGSNTTDPTITTLPAGTYIITGTATNYHCGVSRLMLYCTTIGYVNTEESIISRSTGDNGKNFTNTWTINIPNSFDIELHQYTELAMNGGISGITPNTITPPWSYANLKIEKIG